MAFWKKIYFRLNKKDWQTLKSELDRRSLREGRHVSYTELFVGFVRSLNEKPSLKMKG